MARFPQFLNRCAAIVAGLPLAFLLVAGGLPAASAKDVPYGQGILWRIQATDSPEDAAPNHLFGTMHITDDRVVKLPAPVQEAFDAAESVTFEIVVTPEVQREFGQAMVLTDGRTLESILGTEDFSAAAEAGRRYGLKPAHLRRLKPWALATIFSLPQGELARNANGNLPLDLALQASARLQGKPVHALETPEEQIALFNDMPEDSQVAMLTAAVEQNGVIEKLFEEMVQQYLARDTGGIYARMEAQRETQPELMELFLRRFNDERNKLMVERMADRLRQGGAFIAVGALHLPGENGLLSLLSQRGYRVERVY